MIIVTAHFSSWLNDKNLNIYLKQDIEGIWKFHEILHHVIFILNFKKSYQLVTSNLMEDVLGPVILFFVPNVCGICTWGHVQFYVNRIFENGFRLGTYYSYFWFKSFLIVNYWQLIYFIKKDSDKFLIMICSTNS